jgi:2-methylcitrate dehydratase PrpD
MTPHIAGGSRLGLLKEATAIFTNMRAAQKRAILDTLAVTLLGSRSRAARIAAQAAFGIGAGDGPCSLIGLGRRTDMLNAALINGTSA